MSVLVVVTLLRMFLDVWNGPASSLGELAAREAVRRQAVAATVRTVTNANLEPAPPRPAPAKDTAAESQKAEDAKTGEKPADTAKPVKDEAWWRARITAARQALDRDKLLLAALENRVAVLTRDSVNRDDPAQRAVLLNERIRALEETETMRKQILADEAAIAAIEEEARREGVPPGWIRD